MVFLTVWCSGLNGFNFFHVAGVHIRENKINMPQTTTTNVELPSTSAQLASVIPSGSETGIKYFIISYFISFEVYSKCMNEVYLRYNNRASISQYWSSIYWAVSPLYITGAQLAKWFRMLCWYLLGPECANVCVSAYNI